MEESTEGGAEEVPTAKDLQEAEPLLGGIVVVVEDSRGVEG